jgi:hypothetical protein
MLSIAAMVAPTLLLARGSVLSKRVSRPERKEDE